ncbi:MMPL family transporter [Pendulispora rubella]|uniref:MMPL family transporter n=1 Tax=Pendulispora rubella TaxID=2741070 RepID=A0ABZ2LJ55_9BACT
MIKRIVAKSVDWAGRNPVIVLMLAIATIVASWSYASHLELRTDLLELLPRDSEGFKAFEHQLGRVGGGADLIVVVESPDRGANERFIDAMSAKLDVTMAEHKACLAECKDDASCRATRCGPDLIAYTETGTKDVRKFFQDNKWLYADLKDLEDADNTLDHQIAIGTGMVTDLSAEEPPAPAPAAKAPAHANPASPAPAGSAAAKAAEKPAEEQKKPALGLDQYRDRWQQKANKSDDFPTGYFATPDGKMLGLRIISKTAGMGDANGEALLRMVEKMVAEVNPKSFHPEMQAGLAGAIANATEERQSIMSDAAWATGMALVLILAGLVVFFRSFWSLLIIILPAFVGIGAAYSFAMVTYGYVNTSGAFLGAIILGNGINYPIVLLSRYREFRARGLPPEQARRDAVWNAFRAELVGASVGGIAYGSLVITNFRGFSQFGLIGFVGMLLVWLSMIPTVPALIVILEWIQERLPPWLRDPSPRINSDGSRGPLMRVIANVTERRPWIFVSIAAVLCVVTAWKLPGYLHDPWEYNFDRLGSRGSKSSGAGSWSTKAEHVFGGKMNIAGALMLADSPEQVPMLKEQIFKNDAADPQGKLIADVTTVDDLLPGTLEDQKKKLEVLERIRDRLTPAVLASMQEDERKRVLEVKPPEELAPVAAKDLPALLRRRFEESNGTLGTVFYVKPQNISLSDGYIALRIAKTTDNVKLANGTVVQTASRSTIFAEIIHAMERDGPLATGASFLAVCLVVLVATSSLRGFVVVIGSLVMGVLWTIGGAALIDMKLNFLNFIALPITFGIGSEYPFNVFDRSRLLGGDITSALKRTGGAVALCSYTTTVGYGALLFNDNQALQSFGKLAMSGEVLCLLAALLVLPSILHIWPQKKREEAHAPRQDTGAAAG